MSTLAQLLGAYAPGHSIEHNGKTFTFGRISQKVKAALEMAYFRRARETVYVMREELPEQDYDRQLSRVTDAYNAGRYAYPTGESFAYFINQGLVQFVSILTGQPTEDCEVLVDERMVEVMHIALCITTESFPSLKKTMLSSQKANAIDLQPLLDFLNAS